ncbi:MAG: prepilin-type N-terminal cleavage/methylation domain-containing protein [Candidatus Atribacteria bacterium]|nr:prepilin-type N-terminal cleavage/methylation domain-containing protein [Candidatus Atribacteria bacterium]
MSRGFHNKGFSLLEVILVVAILLFGVTATSVLFSVNLRAGRSNREYAACALLVTDIMERLRSVPFKGGTGQKSVSELVEELLKDENRNLNSIQVFYSYFEVDPPAIVSQVIPGVFSLTRDEDNVTEKKFLSKIEFAPPDSQASSYTVTVTLQWKANMTPVVVKNLVSEGGLNDFLQK